MHIFEIIAFDPPLPPKTDFNLPAFVACMMIVALIIWIGFKWTKKPETRTRGLIVIAIIVVPAVVSGLGVILRIML